MGWVDTFVAYILQKINKIIVGSFSFYLYLRIYTPKKKCDGHVGCYLPFIGMPANMEPLRKDILFAFLSIIFVSSILQINYNNK